MQMDCCPTYLPCCLPNNPPESGCSGCSGDCVGITGPTGPAGKDGAPGPAGPAGKDGQAGKDGNTGPQGPAGTKGNTGPAGKDGATGSQGPAGKDGTTGSQGPAGKDGATGSQGLTGPVGKEGPTGESGRGITSAEVDNNGDLIITWSDGDTATNAGHVVGATGDTGVGISDVALDANNHLMVYLDDGTIIDSGIVPEGPQGSTGEIGPAGITGATGSQGITGEIGPAGDSAYQIWLNEGNSGATSDFISSLQGSQGSTGEIGPAGGTGPGYVSASISASGDLILTDNNAVESNLGPVIGPTGPTILPIAGTSTATPIENVSAVQATYAVYTDYSSLGSEFITTILTFDATPISQSTLSSFSFTVPLGTIVSWTANAWTTVVKSAICDINVFPDGTGLVAEWTSQSTNVEKISVVVLSRNT
jgi:hypothetical protein